MSLNIVFPIYLNILSFWYKVLSHSLSQTAKWQFRACRLRQGINNNFKVRIFDRNKKIMCFNIWFLQLNLGFPRACQKYFKVNDF
jgi:hypothetical protein